MTTQKNIPKNDEERIFLQISTLMINKRHKCYYSLFMRWADGALPLT